MALNLFHRRPDLLPSLGVAFSSALWGLFWIPVRAINEAGVSVAWTSPTMFICVVGVFLPVALWRWRNFLKSDGSFWLACGLGGATFTMYSISFNLTDVIHAMLLFYVSPIWSTLLGATFLGERLTVNRILAIILGFMGLAVILGADGGFPWPRQIGDWFALVAGMLWAVASVRFFKGGATLLIEKTFGFAVSALVAAVILALLPMGIESGLPEIEQIKSAWVWIVIVTAFILPALYLVVWPTTVLSPARVGILFMSESFIGVGSAAYLTDEPFGVREIIGTLLILSAAIVEVIRPQTITSIAPDEPCAPNI